MKRKSLLILTAISLLAFPNLSFGQVPNLGTASRFAVFTAAGAFTNNGATNVTGDIGTHVGAFTGFPPGAVVGQSFVADSVSAQAATDVGVAYGSLSGVTCDSTIGTTLGNGQVLAPRVYCLGGASTLNGNLTLDGQADTSSVFIFKINGPLSTTALSTLTLTNGATWDHVYFQVNGAVILETNSSFRGNILANGAISMLESAKLQGRALSQAGAIDLHNNRIRLEAVAFCGCTP